MARNKNPEITATRILDTARTLFLTKGYEKTTILDIVTELGDLTRGAIYHHFKSKEEILDAVLKSMYDSEGSQLAVNQLPGLNGLEKLRAFLKLNLDITNSDKMQLQKQVVTSHTQDPHFWFKEIGTIFTGKKIPLQLMEEGIADGSIHVSHPQQVLEMTLILFNLYLTWDMRHDKRREYIERLDAVTSMLAGAGFPLIDADFRQVLISFFDILYDE